jgi:hypothetical protein
VCMGRIYDFRCYSNQYHVEHVRNSDANIINIYLSLFIVAIIGCLKILSAMLTATFLPQEEHYHSSSNVKRAYLLEIKVINILRQRFPVTSWNVLMCND